MARQREADATVVVGGPAARFRSLPHLVPMVGCASQVLLFWRPRPRTTIAAVSRRQKQA